MRRATSSRGGEHPLRMYTADECSEAETIAYPAARAFDSATGYFNGRLGALPPDEMEDLAVERIDRHESLPARAVHVQPTIDDEVLALTAA